MRQPVLHMGETVLIRSPDVYVKSFRLTALLTTERIVLSDPYNSAVPDRDLDLRAVVGAEAGETRSGEPVLCVLSRPAMGEVRRLFITFAGQAGSLRTGERDRWVQEISRTCRRSAPAPAVPDPVDLVGQQAASAIPARAPEVLAARLPPVGNTVVGVIVQTVQPGAVAKVPPVSPPEPVPAPPQPPAGLESFFCMACGNRVPYGAKYCNRCGATVIPPNNEVVQSPWDPVQPREDPAALAARWGVPVAPAAPGYPAMQAPTAPVPPYPSGAWGMGPVPGPAPSHPASPFPARQIATVAVLFVITGVMIAVLAGIIPGNGIFGGDNGSVKSLSGSVVSGESLGSTGSSTVEPVSTESSGTQETGTQDSASASTATGSSLSSSESIPTTGTYVHVSGTGSWEGTYGAAPAIWAVKGDGDKIYKIDDSAGTGTVGAVFSKDDTTSNDLVVEVYKDGQLIKSGKTASPSGSVTLAAAS